MVVCCIEPDMMVVACVLHWLVRIVRTSCLDSPGLRVQNTFSLCAWLAICIHDCFFSAHTHPTVIYIKSDLSCIYLPLFDICEVKFEIQIHGILLGGALCINELYLFWISNEVHGVVINHQKGGDWKESWPLSGFGVWRQNRVRLICWLSMCAGATHG